MAAAIPLRAGERKVVIVGAGFLGSHIARALSQNPSNRIQLTSRNPTKLRDQLLSDDISVNKPRAKSLLPTIHSHSLLPPVTADITDLNSLKAAFTDATVVISLVGLLSGTREQFDKVQWKGVQNVVDAIKEVNARKGGGSGIKKIVHVSAIGANEDSGIDYFRTKGLGEKVLFEAFQTNDIQSPSPHVTVIRPSLVFGPDDSFFNRFATLAKFMPFLPVFGGGSTRFQPVYVGDLAAAVEICSRVDPEVEAFCGNKTLIQAGGPEVFSYRQLMEQVLHHSQRRRPIVSLPYSLGMIQGRIFEVLPETILTVTRSQVEQLKLDNIVTKEAEDTRFGQNNIALGGLLEKFGREGEKHLRSVGDILPLYI